MKCLAGESAGSFVVEGIAEQRMADVSHVDADLVGAAGFEVEFEVGENGAVREGAVMGYGALAGTVFFIIDFLLPLLNIPQIHLSNHLLKVQNLLLPVKIPVYFLYHIFCPQSHMRTYLHSLQALQVRR